MPKLVRLQNGFLSAVGAPGAEAYDVVGTDDEDRETYGEVPLMQCLGVASLPGAPSPEGYCEGVLVEDVGGLPGVIVGAWDTRTFSIFGNLEPGDTVLHSTGPAKSAQVLCKETKRQTVMATLGPDGKQMMVICDGKNGTLQLTAHGYMIQIDKDGIILEAGDAGISVGPNGIWLRGAVTIGGQLPQVGMSMAVAPTAAWSAIGAVPIPNAIGAL
jgi:hypothetical protein